MALKTIYHYENLTGGVDSTYIDYTDGNSLSDKDRALVIAASTFYLYELNATSGAAESSPNIISPDTNAGTKRWILITTYSLTSVTTSVTAADNTSSTAIATTAFAKSQDAVLHRDPDQSVNMTAAASGSSGITVADDDDIDFGTGNFTLVWKGSLPDWTPSAPVKLLWKMDTDAAPDVGINLGVGYPSAGSIYFTIKETVYSSSIVNTFVDNTVHELAVVTTVGATNTLVDLYFDGMAFGAQQTAANPGSVSNAIALEILGDLVSRTAGTVTHAYTLNRAMTAAEVLDLYQKGIAFADKWGSQTELITAQVDRDFSGACNWTNNGYETFDTTGDLSLVNAGGEAWVQIAYTNFNGGTGFRYGKKYRLKYDAANLSGSMLLGSSSNLTSPSIPAFVAGTNQYIEFTWLETSATASINIYAGGAGAGDFDNFSLVEIGATLALTPESKRRDKWYDCSSNNLDASYPATGWTLTRKADTGLFQPVPTAETTAVTLTIAKLLTGIITATHTVGATQAYTLPTGALIDAWPAFNIGDSFDWSLINLSAAAADTVTVTADTGHTIVGNPIVQSAHSSTGGVYGNSSLWRTKKTAASVFVSYRVA